MEGLGGQETANQRRRLKQRIVILVEVEFRIRI